MPRRNQEGYPSPGGGIDGQLAQEGKETELCRLDVDPNGEEHVHEMHPSVRVDPN